MTVSRLGDQLIAVKQVGPDRAGEVEREAGLLRRLDHPGLVRFLNLVTLEGGAKALHTEFVSSDTWATRPLADPTERAQAMAALAAVVADLHDLNVAHLRLSPGHILHGSGDRPILCGLTRAGEASERNRQVDLTALAELCHDAKLERGPMAGKLSSLADALRAGRLNARELARRLDQMLAKRAGRSRHKSDRRPDHAGPTTSAATHGSKRRATLSPRLLAVGAGVLVAITATGLAVSLLRGSAPEGGDEQHAPTAARAVGVAAVPESSDTPGGVPAPDAAEPYNSSAEPSAPPDRSTITATGPQPVADAGVIVEHGGRRYAIGVDGDLVAQGDWDCDGEPTPAIVRPATGDVVLFDQWPGPDETVVMPVSGQVERPTGVEVVRQGSCDLLRVFTPAGSRLIDPRRIP